MNYEAVTLGYAIDPEHPDPTPIEGFHEHVVHKLMSTLSARLVHEVERRIVEYQFYEDIFLMDEDDIGLSGWSDDQMWFGFTGETAGIGEHWFTSITSLERWAPSSPNTVTPCRPSRTPRRSKTTGGCGCPYPVGPRWSPSGPTAPCMTLTRCRLVASPRSRI